MYFQRDDTTDCPGVLFDYATVSGCCVGGILPPVIVSTCAGWPVCTGPVTTTTTDTPVSCATIITYTDGAVYTSEVEAASSSIAASGTVYQTTLKSPDSAATPTTTTSADVTTTDALTSGADGASGTARVSGSGGEGKFIPAIGLIAAAGLAVVVPYGCSCLILR